MSVVPLRRVALGDVHPYGRCAFCGARSSLRTTALCWTHAPGRVCADRIACTRRREISRRLVA
jgi:hypothetical protein